MEIPAIPRLQSDKRPRDDSGRQRFKIVASEVNNDTRFIEYQVVKQEKLLSDIMYLMNPSDSIRHFISYYLKNLNIGKSFCVNYENIEYGNWNISITRTS